MLDTLRANPLPATEQIVAPKAKEGPDTVDPIGIILENPSPIKTQAQGGPQTLTPYLLWKMRMKKVWMLRTMLTCF